MTLCFWNYVYFIHTQTNIVREKKNWKEICYVLIMSSGIIGVFYFPYYFFVITVCYFYNLKKINNFYFKITLCREPRIIPGSPQLCLEPEKLQSHISRSRVPLMITQLGHGLKAVGFYQAAPGESGMAALIRLLTSGAATS